MNILITGGTGFIGSHLLNKLIHTNHKIFVLKKTTSDTWRIKDIQKKLEFIDFEETRDLEKIFSKNKFELIIHLAAAYIKNHKSSEDIIKLIYSNVTFPSILLDVASKHQVKGFINTGTCFEYKLSRSKLTEESVRTPHNFYAATKIAFEEVLKYYTNEGRICGTSLKLFYAYGEKDTLKIIPLMINSLIKNIPLKCSLGEQRLNFTYVGDIVNAFIKAIEFTVKNKPKNYQSFNISSDKIYTLKKLKKILEKISGKKSAISFSLPYPENEVKYMSCDVTKSKRLLKWEPKTDIVDGLTKTYNFYLDKALTVKSRAESLKTR